MATKKLQVTDATLIATGLDVKNEVERYFTERPNYSLAIDKLCPSFTATGSVATCEPVEGYPLDVQTAEGATKVTRTGKNLLGYTDFEGITGSGNNQSCIGGVITKNTTSTNLNTSWVLVGDARPYLRNNRLAPGTYVFSISQTSTTGILFKNPYLDVTLDDGTSVSLPNGVTTTIDQYATIKNIRCETTRFSELTTVTATVQLEVGNTATKHEPCVVSEFAAGKPVLAFPGINTIWADTGDVTVTGRADPNAIIEKLTDAVVALGGNV